ncbi:MAG: X-Pro dipeptidyl-peptidase [Algoriphagus sp. 32-45-6]|nr:MAG: X-Pro dipeptidyl-peptidase [Algoriphagus sp. 32-45-6]
MKKIALFVFLVLGSLWAEATELVNLITTYQADRGALSRLYTNRLSAEYFARMESFNQDYLKTLQAQNYDALSEDGKIDYVLFRNFLEKQLAELDLEKRDFMVIQSVVAFGKPLEDFVVARRRAKQPDAQALAASWDAVAKAVAAQHKSLASASKYTSWQQADLAAQAVESLNRVVKEAYDFYYDYDPAFTWWMPEPWKKLDASMKAYAKALREHYTNSVKDDGSGIIGKPIGREALEKQLAFEMIAYSPEELIAEAEKQFAWCEKEMLKASNELGFGNDWKAALEMVKETYLPAGAWPEEVVRLGEEAIDLMEKNDWLTVPPLAKETWRTTMISAERQRVSPFFLGGEVIQISYPTSEMSHEEKMMSMRGNNPHFSRATVQHELIPGHHLQQFMNQRNMTHRRMFGTPFWTEGWALYWEFVLWDRNFPRDAKDKVGMLFWRMHRCARIIFSLNYHLGKMTPQQCIDLLVDKVGHERANAEAEVRRSFEGSYGPLYQIAYMIGALEIYSMRKELVDSGKMPEKQFHDLILTQNAMPIEILRAKVTGKPLDKNHKASWRFLD